MTMIGHRPKCALQDSEVDMEDLVCAAANDYWERNEIWLDYEVTGVIDLPYQVCTSNRRLIILF
jgi:hypothetical protein